MTEPKGKMSGGYVNAFLSFSCLKRGLKVSVLVGTLLIIINHFDTLRALDPLPLWQMPLTYAVPFFQLTQRLQHLTPIRRLLKPANAINLSGQILEEDALCRFLPAC